MRRLFKYADSGCMVAVIIFVALIIITGLVIGGYILWSFIKLFFSWD